MARKLIQNLTSGQRDLYFQLHSQYIQATVLAEHQTWHTSNGSGGTTGPGSGEEFLKFHRRFIRRLEFFMLDNGGAEIVPVPKWDPSTPIPSELPDSSRTTSNPNISLPSWATVAGGTTQSPIFNYTNLLQFQNPDEIGRALGASYHGSVHGTIGGAMAGFHSPEDPIFFPWHAWVDDILEEWYDHNAGVRHTHTWHELESSTGTVSSILAEQVDSRHQLWFTLGGDSNWYYYYLDEHIPIARVQTNLLRTSVRKSLQARIYWDGVIIAGTSYRKVYAVGMSA